MNNPRVQSTIEAVDVASMATGVGALGRAGIKHIAKQRAKRTNNILRKELSNAIDAINKATPVRTVTEAHNLVNSSMKQARQHWDNYLDLPEVRHMLDINARMSQRKYSTSGGFNRPSGNDILHGLKRDLREPYRLNVEDLGSSLG